MIRFLRALAWVRWRTLYNTIRSGRKRDGVEALSRIGNVLVPIVYGLMLIPAALALAAGGMVGGWLMAHNEAPSALAIVFARVVLALVTVAVLTAPLVRTMQGLQLNLTRLLLLPISRRLLHATELVGGLVDPWVLIVIPGLVFLSAGLIFGGLPAAGLLSLLAAALLLLALAALSSLGTFVVMLVFRDRRRAEWFTLVALVGLSLLGLLPILFEESVDVATDQGAGESRPPDFEAMFRWAAPLPSELYAGVISAAVEGRTGPAWRFVGALGVWAGILYGLSTAVHRRLLEQPERGKPRRSGPLAQVRLPTIPGIGATTCVVALMQSKTALRTVRGKMAVYFVAIFVAFFGLITIPRIELAAPELLSAPLGPLILFAGALLSFLSLQPILMNQFAVDGSGLTLQLLAPVSNREVALGKALGCLLLGSISIVLCLVGAIVVRPGGHLFYWTAMALVCFGGLVILVPSCTIVSAFFPKPADLNRLGKAGNPHALAGFLGFLLTAAALAPPLALFAAGTFLAESPGFTLAVSFGWTVASLLLWIPLVRLAAATLERRRENLYLIVAER